MKKTVSLLAFILAQCITMNAQAQSDMAVQADAALKFSGQCTYPNSPDTVNGATATEAQMLQFQKEMKDYLAKGNEFLTCLDKEEGVVTANATSEQREEFKAKVVQTHNAVVDEMNAIADAFNTALRAYKAKNP